MNPLREMILNEIVRPEVRASSKIYLGTIEACNISTNTADVRLGIAADELYRNVPFARGASYVHGSEPSMGTPVIVSFLSGDMNYPYIIAMLNDGAVDMGTGKGVMMPDPTMYAIPAPIDLSQGYYGGHPLY